MTGTSLDHLRSIPQERLTALTVGIAVTLGLIAAGALIALARPAGQAGELAALDARVARVETLKALQSRQATLPSGHVCTGPLQAQADRLRVELARRVNGLHFAQVRVQTTPGAGVVSYPLQPVRFTLDAAGDYPAAVHLIQALGRHSPAVLLDRVDLGSRDTFLKLHLDGRVYCRAAPTF